MFVSQRFAGFNPGRGDSCTAFQWTVCWLLFFFVDYFYLSLTQLHREYITSSEMYSLHLTHPKWTHTRSSGQPCYSARGAVGGSVPCSRTPQSWYWRRRERWLFTPPTNNPCRTWDSNPQPSDSLSIRPRLPPNMLDAYCTKNGSSNIIGWFTRSQAGTVSASEDEVTGFASLPCKWHQMFEKLVLSAQQKV